MHSGVWLYLQAHRYMLSCDLRVPAHHRPQMSRWAGLYDGGARCSTVYNVA